ncbi:MAG: GldG family protein [Spirochaetia bacterium]|nr:GldG family protein [Spirochaetia bacterium]
MKNFQNSKKITTILIIILFLLINWVSYGSSFRFDLSKSGRLRLTSKTENILRNLPEKVTIEAFFSNEVPASHIQQLSYLKDFLKEYASASKGKIKLIFLDPDTDEEAKNRASHLGIRPARMGSIDQKKQEISAVYFSLALSYGSDNQIIDNILNVRLLEYELTGRIYRLAYPGEKQVGFLSNHGEFNTRELMQNADNFATVQAFKDSIQTVYGNLVDIDTEKEEIPSEVTTLLIVGPNRLSPIDKFKIDQFLLRGGNIILAMSGMSISLQTGQATPADVDVLSFFKNYGITISDDMVYERKNFLPFRQPVGPFQVIEIPYPIWVVAEERYMHDSSLITKDLPSLFIPWTSSIKIDEKQLIDGEDKKIDILIRTSTEAWTEKNNIFIAPNAIKESLQNKNQTTTGQYDLAAYLKGRFNSYYSSNPLPKEAPKEYLKASEKPGQILVIGSPYAIINIGVLQSQGVNMNFFLSTLDIMNDMEELVEVRQKEISTPPLPSMEQGEKNLITLLNFLLPVLFIGALGAFVAYRRKNLSNIQVLFKEDPVEEEKKDNTKGDK